MVWKSEYLTNFQIDSDALGQKISIWKPLFLVTRDNNSEYHKWEKEKS